MSVWLFQQGERAAWPGLAAMMGRLRIPPSLRRGKGKTLRILPTLPRGRASTDRANDRGAERASGLCVEVRGEC